MDETVQNHDIESMPNGNKKTKVFDFSRHPKRRIALMFLYFGWEYDGLVQQRDISNTVEEEMKKALLKTKLIESWEDCGWNRCGRTDKGVSAFKQIASVIVRCKEPSGDHVPWSHSGILSDIYQTSGELVYMKMLNGTLPKNIRVLAWAPVGEDFNARHKCKERTYTYAFPRGNFNIRLMKFACDLLVGTHDFRNFCRIDKNKERVEMSYVRTITHAGITPISCNSAPSKSSNETSPYDFFQLTIKGSGFLWHQIRCIMAVLYEIGNGNEIPGVIRDLLNVDFYPSKPTYGLAPASPLCLFGCSYGGYELEWRWDIDSLKSVKNHILETWAHYHSLSAMLRNMADGIGALVPDLENECSGLNTFIKPSGTSTRKYVPIMRRPTCDSLEVKRMKLHAKTSSPYDRDDSSPQSEINDRLQ